ncbi:MAG: hypothetical protein RI897_1946 [Verrucomicrobiota bacterium]|jgi:tRNA threonylcarbamoyladenosine biosynthesis protein TsaE
MVTSISRSPEETLTLGEQWGREAQPGWVFALSGDLGAGKTHLVRGIARGLGSPARVHSPTFAILTTYEGGRCPLHHLDLYRLSDPNQVFHAGLEDYLYPRNAVAVVEWAENWLGPKDSPNRNGILHLRSVHFEIPNPTTREISYEDSGT